MTAPIYSPGSPFSPRGEYTRNLLFFAANFSLSGAVPFFLSVFLLVRVSGLLNCDRWLGFALQFILSLWDFFPVCTIFLLLFKEKTKLGRQGGSEVVFFSMILEC